MHEFWCDLILPCVFPIFPYASRSSIIFLSLSVDLEYYLSGKPSNKSLWSALLKKKHYYHRWRYVDTFFSVSWNNAVYIRVWVQYLVLTSCLSVSLFFLLSSASLSSFYIFFLYLNLSVHYYLEIINFCNHALIFQLLYSSQQNIFHLFLLHFWNNFFHCSSFEYQTS